MGEYDNSEDTNQDFERPEHPRIEAVLIKILERGKRMPKMFPENKLEAANFWISKQEPPKEEREAVEWQSNPKHRDGGFWKSPYIDRLAFTLKKFLALGSPRQFFVIENIDKGCPWRGDGIDFFKMVVQEHQKMQEMGADEYISKAKVTARGYLPNL